MVILKKIGFKKNWIYEVIVTTKNSEGIINSAPMGVSTNDFNKIKLKVYKESKTCRNISETDFFTVDIIDNLEIFYDSLFLKEKIEYERNSLRIKNSLCSLYLETEEKIDVGNSIVFYGKINSYKLRDDLGDFELLLNRGRNLTLESLVKCTKKPFPKEEIIENLRVIKKVSPDSIYERIVKNIIKKT